MSRPPIQVFLRRADDRLMVVALHPIADKLLGAGFGVAAMGAAQFLVRHFVWGCV